MKKCWLRRGKVRWFVCDSAHFNGQKLLSRLERLLFEINDVVLCVFLSFAGLAWHGEG